MSTAPDQTLHDLTDFSGLLAELDREAVQYAVIGGCAVGVYARLRGRTVLSADLDLYAAPSTLTLLHDRAHHFGFRLVKAPEARAIPVAVFDWRGLEVNALTASRGLPEPSAVIRDAREIHVEQGIGFDVPVADPFDLLANKLALRREKDLPHIEILREFVEAEAIFEFGEATPPRRRMAAATRLLTTLGVQTLPVDVAFRLIPLADCPPLRRFIASRAPNADVLDAIVMRAPQDERAELASVGQNANPDVR